MRVKTFLNIFKDSEDYFNEGVIDSLHRRANFKWTLRGLRMRPEYKMIKPNNVLCQNIHKMRIKQNIMWDFKNKNCVFTLLQLKEKIVWQVKVAAYSFLEYTN